MNTTIVNNILEGKILCKNKDGSQLYGLTRNTLSKMNIYNWELNRPYDNTRIPEIVEQLKRQDYIDGIIYLAKKDNRVICYDGIHRIEAIKYLQKTKNNINHKIIVHYYPFYNEQLIKYKFETLNKCVPVPELYTSAHKELNIKNMIEDIVKHFYVKYFNMFKPSAKPNIPHENRDNFTNKIQNIIEQLDLFHMNFNDFINFMEKYNIILREKVNQNETKIKLSKKQLEKCKYNNCYLFITKDWEFRFIQYYKTRNNTINKFKSNEYAH